MANYETVPLRMVLDGISALMGAEPAKAGSPEHVSFVAHIFRHFTRGWTYDFWPEWTPVELRAYRDAWDAALTYAMESEVLFGDKYWTNETIAPPGAVPGEESALTDETGAALTDETGASITDGTEVWEELTALARAVPLVQAGKIPIGAVSRVCRRNPRLYPNSPGELKFDLTDLGVMPDSRAGVAVWIEFRRRVPRLSAELWSNAKAYAVDAVVYDDDSGDCYQAIQGGVPNHPVTDAAWWSKVEFPARLKDFVVTACYADALRGDGQTGKALAEQGNAESFLLQAYDDAFGGQGQYSSASYSMR